MERGKQKTEEGGDDSGREEKETRRKNYEEGDE